MTPGNWIIIIIGIAICFFAIIFKKLFEGILGFVWGVSFTYIILFIMALAGSRAIQDMDDTSALVCVILVALIIAVLSIIFERVLMSIRAFLIAFIITLFFFAIVSYDFEVATILILASVISLLVAAVMWHFHKKAFIIESALTGAILINHVGLTGGTNPTEYLSNSIYGYNNSDKSSTALIITVLIAIAGYIVQSMILSKMESGEFGKTNGGGNGGTTLDLIGTIRSKVEMVLHSQACKELISEKVCCVFALAGFVIVPLIHNYLSYDVSYGIHNTIFTLRNILTGVAYIGVIYFGFNKSLKSGLLYCAPAVLVNTIIEWDLIRITTASSLMHIVSPILVLLIVRLLGNYLHKPCRYLVAMIVYIGICYFLYRWIADKHFFWPIYQFDYIPIICMLLVLVVFVKLKCQQNIFDKYTIGFAGVIIALILVYKGVTAWQIRKNSAVGQYYQNGQNEEQSQEDMGQEIGSKEDSGKEDDDTSIENITSDMVTFLTSEKWEIYDAKDYYSGEAIMPTDPNIFANNLTRVNSLHFRDDYSFDFAFSWLEMSGKYSVENNVVTLYSDSTTDVIQMEIGNYSTWNGFETQALIWDYENEYGRYYLYLVNPSFYS